MFRVTSNLLISGAGRKLLASGGLYMNYLKLKGTPEENKVEKRHLIDESLLLLRAGKTSYTIISVV